MVGVSGGSSFSLDFSRVPIHPAKTESTGAPVGAAKDGDDGTGSSKATAPATLPAPTPSGAGPGAKGVGIFPVSLPGSMRDPFADVARADAIWAQCSLRLTVKGGESWNTNLLDTLAPTATLNEYSSPTSPTQEELGMLEHHPGGKGMIHAYFVPAMSAGSRGESFWASMTPNGVRAVVISDSAASDTFAHELGHVLFDDGGHHADVDNLMADGSVRNVGVDKLDAAQCARV